MGQPDIAGTVRGMRSVSGEGFYSQAEAPTSSVRIDRDDRQPPISTAGDLRPYYCPTKSSPASCPVGTDTANVIGRSGPPPETVVVIVAGSSGGVGRVSHPMSHTRIDSGRVRPRCGRRAVPLLRRISRRDRRIGRPRPRGSAACRRPAKRSGPRTTWPACPWEATPGGGVDPRPERAGGPSGRSPRRPTHRGMWPVMSRSTLLHSPPWAEATSSSPTLHQTPAPASKDNGSPTMNFVGWGRVHPRRVDGHRCLPVRTPPTRRPTS